MVTTDRTTQIERTTADETAPLRRYLQIAAAWFLVLLVLPEAVKGPWYLAFGVYNLVLPMYSA